jgi:predicted nucleotidyltransferase
MEGLAGMREKAPAIFPVLRSRLTAAVLARAYIGDGEYSVADLAATAGTDTGTMTREVRRLEEAGVLRSRMVGRTKLVQANHDAPFYRPLRDLVVIVLGPADIIGEELAKLTGIEAAAIFGSWAARAMGEPGPTPADIDLLVIGRPDRDDLHEAVGRARQKLGRDINPVTLSADRWNAGEDPFLEQVRGRPMVKLKGVPAPESMAAAP